MGGKKKKKQKQKKRGGEELNPLYKLLLKKINC